MSRQSRREQVATAIAGLGFTDVYEGVRRTFGGRSPVAVVLSRSYAILDLTVDGHDQVNIGLSVTIYVRADQGQEDAAEDRLDQLLEGVADALRDAHFIVGESDAAPDGAPLRNIDGVFYRAERIPVSFEEYD